MMSILCNQKTPKVTSVYSKKMCLYLEHQWGVQHVLYCQVKTFVQVLIGKLSEQLDVV